MENFKIVDVTPDNIAEVEMCCAKDKKAPGNKAKVGWFRQEGNKGVRIKIAVRENKQIGFLEYIDSENAWRPVEAKNFLFIHCMAVYSKPLRNKKIGTSLIGECEKDAREQQKSGVCVMSSSGTWMVDKQIFEYNGYKVVDKLCRYELLAKNFEENTETPRIISWEKNKSSFIGWHLLYSDQCPWHDKSANDLQKAAKEPGIELNIRRIGTSLDARNAPSGFGVFSLIKDCKLIEDHYISKTRFLNIITKEGD